jgi:hypothetical protein
LRTKKAASEDAAFFITTELRGDITSRPEQPEQRPEQQPEFLLSSPLFWLSWFFCGVCGAF